MKCQNCDMEISNRAIICPYCRLHIGYNVQQFGEDLNMAFVIAVIIGIVAIILGEIL